LLCGFSNASLALVKPDPVICGLGSSDRNVRRTPKRNINTQGPGLDAANS
jgi:hypothetical protein